MKENAISRLLATLLFILLAGFFSKPVSAAEPVEYVDENDEVQGGAAIGGRT